MMHQQTGAHSMMQQQNGASPMMHQQAGMAGMPPNIPGMNPAGPMADMQRMMATMTQMQEEMNQQREGEIPEPGAPLVTENAYDPNAFNQRFQTPNNGGIHPITSMGSTTPPPQQAQPNSFAFNNYQSVMKQVHTPDGGTFSQNQNFNFPAMNSFHNGGFNQNQTQRSPSGPYGASPTPGGTPTGMPQNMWPMNVNTQAGTPTGGFSNSNPMSQFVQTPGGTTNRNFNKMNPQ